MSHSMTICEKIRENKITSEIDTRNFKLIWFFSRRNDENEAVISCETACWEI